jgi:RHS repeat-associated protein
MEQTCSNLPFGDQQYCFPDKRQSMTDASGTTNYNYDAMDRLISKATPEGTLSYTYDAAGNLASMASSNAHGVSVGYQYDSLNRLVAVVDGNLTGANTTTYTYDDASNVATVTFPNGVRSTFTYDTLNRVSELSSAPASYQYQRGPTGNLTSGSESSGRTINWTYDGIDRLTNETISLAPSGKNGTVGYSLDPVGNRLNDTSSLSGITAGSWTFNADDEVASESYDNNGNVTATGGKAFSYDSENHLVSMNSGAVTLVYDGDGNRVAKTVGGVTTYYLVDDLNPTGYAQVVDELTGGSVSRQYTYGLQRISQQQEISSAWTPSFYGYDGGGTVRNLTDSSGTVTDSYEYDAFGNSFTVSGSTPNNYLYRGEQWDADLGLYYLRARYYNPLTGRFLSRDPEDGNVTNPASLHKYNYASGDPVNRLDPTGRADAIEYALLRFVPAAITFTFGKCAWDIGFSELGYKQPGMLCPYAPAWPIPPSKPWPPPPLPTPPCDCTPFEAVITFWMNTVTWRYNELLIDRWQLYCLAFDVPSLGKPPGTWVGHLIAFKAAQAQLTRAILAANAFGCPIPWQAWGLASMPPPICPAGRIPRP